MNRQQHTKTITFAMIKVTVSQIRARLKFSLLARGPGCHARILYERALMSSWNMMRRRISRGPRICPACAGQPKGGDRVVLLAPSSPWPRLTQQITYCMYVFIYSFIYFLFIYLCGTFILFHYLAS